jgi:hypothetical protein
VARATANRAGWGALVSGAASAATLPVAIYATRFSDSYELLHAGFAIPVGAALGLLSLHLARRARRLGALALGRSRGERLARVGRALGLLGLGLAAAALVSVAVYGLLEYAGTR